MGVAVVRVAGRVYVAKASGDYTGADEPPDPLLALLVQKVREHQARGVVGRVAQNGGQQGGAVVHGHFGVGT